MRSWVSKYSLEGIVLQFGLVKERHVSVAEGKRGERVGYISPPFAPPNLGYLPSPFDRIPHLRFAGRSLGVAR